MTQVLGRQKQEDSGSSASQANSEREAKKKIRVESNCGRHLTSVPGRHIPVSTHTHTFSVHAYIQK